MHKGTTEFCEHKGFYALQISPFNWLKDNYSLKCEVHVQKSSCVQIRLGI